jgi:hypothetical protein
MTLTDWILAGVAALALLVSIAAVVLSRRAVQAAHRAEAAAHGSREAAAGELWARRKLAQEHAIRWTLTRHGAATNELVNIGDKTAYDVRVEVPEGMDVLGLPTEYVQVLSGESVTLGVARSRLGSRDALIRVRWRDAPGGAEREWTHPAV